MGTSVDFGLLLVDLEHLVPRQKGLFRGAASWIRPEDLHTVQIAALHGYTQRLK
jgi:hypothetical protein